MDSKPEPNGRTIRGVRLTDDEWAAALRIAAELGCTRTSGEPSLSRLLTEIADGSLRVRRARPTRTVSQAERIRAVITANPDAQNKDIAAWLGLEGRKGLVNVASERHRMRARTEGQKPTGGSG